MTDSRTIDLISELDAVQETLISEERLLDSVMADGGPPEEAFHSWHRAYDRFKDVRDEVIEIAGEDLDSPAFMAVEMADLRAEAVEVEWELRSLESLGFTEEDLKVQLAQGLLDACEERIAEIKARLDLLRVAAPDEAALNVVPINAATIMLETEAPAEVSR